ncbi:hypothetical protein PT974_03454 [Cladobotryum mycophilum]|uniref:Heterokaryon incompatibility domain-containing protein n=1 Tax=Cladobotryum mycophilum TaxID=491253 RepID=A0ABR0STI9_9HYPO
MKLSEHLGRHGNTQDIVAGPPQYSQPKGQTAVKLHPDWINIDDLRTWVRSCDEKHGASCAPSPDLTGRPEWLIDVCDNCIVPAESHHRYLALSYVWGQVSAAETTLANVSGMRQPGSLSPLNNKFIVPKTIQHAMGLVRLLSERYLWVDRFCICQDDEASKHSQINNMGGIFANAHVTIIAANGWDADHGLRGIKGVTEPRQISPNFDHDYMESLQPFSTIWYHRGWTFQELFFSKRKIFFQYQVAVWECSCSLWHEGTGLTGHVPTSNDGAGNHSSVRSMSPWGISQIPKEPDLQLYFRIVGHYNDRKLSFPEDGYRAFLGVITALTPIFPGGFIWGLPVTSFAESLLWVPLQQGKRRMPKKTQTSDQLPSWSWVGWEGPVSPIQGIEGWVPYRKPPAVSGVHALCEWKWPSKGHMTQLRDKTRCDRPSGDESPSEHREIETELSNLLRIDSETTKVPLHSYVHWIDGGEPVDKYEHRGYNEWLDTKIGSEGNRQQFEVVLIARSINASYSTQHGKLKKTEEETLLQIDPTWCNCIIFEKRDGLAYRIGVVIIPESQWRAMKKKRRETLVFA